MSSALWLPGLALAAYLWGSWNAAIVLLRAGGKPDPRAAGSGNAGTTNVLRVAGWRWAVVVFAVDLARAGVLALLAQRWLPAGQVAWVALALVLGNRLPLFHGLRGGKGVAALLGFVLFVAPLAAAAAAALWLLLRYTLRWHVPASLAMAATAAAGLAWAAAGEVGALLAALGCFALVLWGHAPNLVRGRAGAPSPAAEAAAQADAGTSRATKSGGPRASGSGGKS